MSLIDLASLVLAPTATKEGKVYSAIPDTGEGDMTFSRGSAATRVNSEGLIEKERANLLTYSNDFSNAAWTKSASTITADALTSPQGATNASYLTDNTANNFHGLYAIKNISSVVTCSIFVKYDNKQFVSFLTNNNGASDRYAYFDLVNKTTHNISSGLNAMIEDVGSGWLRLSVMSVSSANGYYWWNIAASNSSTAYIGDGTGRIGIFGSQLEQGLVATDYIETTTTAVYEGITDDVPRVDYSGGGCPSLLLEPQRTNLLEHSEYFDSWAKGTNVSVTANQATSPEGTQNAYISTNTDSSAVFVYELSQSASTSWAVSVFAKKGTNKYLGISICSETNVNSRYQPVFDLENGTLQTENSSGSNVTNTSYKIENFGNGWYRLTAIGTFAGGSEKCYIVLQHSNNTSYNPTTNTLDWQDATNGNCYFYGAQLEAGNYPTSYIPTYGTSTTRVQDSCSKTGISELIGQTEGTVYIEFDNNQLSTYPNEYIYQIVDGTTELWIRKESGGSGFTARLIVSGSTIWTIGIIPPDGLTKIATAYKSGDSVIYMNGSVVGSVNTSTFSGSSFDTLNFFRSTLKPELLLKQAILFPTRLTNDQLQELTK